MAEEGITNQVPGTRLSAAWRVSRVYQVGLRTKHSQRGGGGRQGRLAWGKDEPPPEHDAE